jgi:hypothetical protein
LLPGVVEQVLRMPVVVAAVDCSKDSPAFHPTLLIM